MLTDKNQNPFTVGKIEFSPLDKLTNRFSGFIDREKKPAEPTKEKEPVAEQTQDPIAEARKRQRQRWRLNQYFEIQLAKSGALHASVHPDNAFRIAKTALDVWEKNNPGEYEDEELLRGAK